MFCNEKHQSEAIKWHKLIVRLIAWLQILIERLVAIKNFSLIPTLLRIVRVYVRLIFLKLKKLIVNWIFQTVNVAHRHITVFQKTNRIILQTNHNCKTNSAWGSIYCYCLIHNRPTIAIVHYNAIFFCKQNQCFSSFRSESYTFWELNFIDYPDWPNIIFVILVSF